MIMWVANAISEENQQMLFLGNLENIIAHTMLTTYLFCIHDFCKSPDSLNQNLPTLYRMFSFTTRVNMVIPGKAHISLYYYINSTNNYMHLNILWYCIFDSTYLLQNCLIQNVRYIKSTTHEWNTLHYLNIRLY